MNEYYRCYAEISLSAIEHNLKEIRKKLDEDVRLFVVIKADAYGHGACAVASRIKSIADTFCVACVEEACELRNAGIDTPILILGYSSPMQYDELIRYGLTPSIYSVSDAEKLSKAAVSAGVKMNIHIAVDTGMTRIGLRSSEKTADMIERIYGLPGIKIEGIFSHFACADIEGENSSDRQIEEFTSLLKMLERRSIDIPCRHICNSAGIITRADARMNAVRAGILTYGMFPADHLCASGLDIRPALSWKTHVINVAEVEKGRGVSYGAEYVTYKEKTKVATLAVGYADGYPRALSDKGVVLIRGKRAPVIGKVCMDLMMVDVTDVPDVEIGDTATLIGTDGSETVTAEEFGALADSFNYETVCRISKRVKRIYR